MAPSKAEKKEQKKVIEDKTFGLKNKNKSKVVQKYVKGVEQTVKNHNASQTKLQQQYYAKKAAKKQLQQEKALLNALYANVGKNQIEQTSSDDDEDPANTVCPYFKQGLCQKGKKCIYSHDLTIGRTEQIDLYTDQRTQLIMNAIGGKQLDKMSEDELNSVLGQKQKQMMKGTRSNIVCKFFLQAVEKDKYGWKWNCPNGEMCKYKHCLPPGYKLKKDEQGKNKIDVDEIPIETLIDEQRNNLLSQNKSSPLVTFEVFMKWKAERKARKEKEAAKKAKQEVKKGIKGQVKTGRQLFIEDRNLFVDDQEAVDEFVKEEVVEEEPEEKNDATQQGQEDEEEQEEKE